MDMVCPKNGRPCPLTNEDMSKILGKKGGEESRRTLSTEQAKKMVEIRENKKRSK